MKTKPHTIKEQTNKNTSPKVSKKDFYDFQDFLFFLGDIPPGAISGRKVPGSLMAGQLIYDKAKNIIGYKPADWSKANVMYSYGKGGELPSVLGFLGPFEFDKDGKATGPLSDVGMRSFLGERRAELLANIKTLIDIENALKLFYSNKEKRNRKDIRTITVNKKTYALPDPDDKSNKNNKKTEVQDVYSKINNLRMDIEEALDYFKNTKASKIGPLDTILTPTKIKKLKSRKINVDINVVDLAAITTDEPRFIDKKLAPPGTTIKKGNKGVKPKWKKLQDPNVKKVFDILAKKDETLKRQIDDFYNKLKLYNDYLNSNPPRKRVSKDADGRDTAPEPENKKDEAIRLKRQELLQKAYNTKIGDTVSLYSLFEAFVIAGSPVPKSTAGKTAKITKQNIEKIKKVTGPPITTVTPSTKKVKGPEGAGGESGGSLKDVVVDFYIELAPFKECKFKGKNSSLHAAATGVFQGIGAKSGISIANRITSKKTAGVSKKIISIMNATVGNSKKFGKITQLLRALVVGSSVAALSDWDDTEDMAQNLGTAAGLFHPLISVLTLSGLKAWKEETGLVGTTTGTAKNIFSIPACYLDTTLYSAGLVSIFGVGAGAGERAVRAIPGAAKFGAENAPKMIEKFRRLSQWYEGLGEKARTGEKLWKIPVEVFDRKRKLHDTIQKTIQEEIFKNLSLIGRTASWSPISSSENVIIQRVLKNLLDASGGQPAELIFVVKYSPEGKAYLDLVSQVDGKTPVDLIYERTLETLKNLSKEEKNKIVEELKEIREEIKNAGQKTRINWRILTLTDPQSVYLPEYYEEAAKTLIATLNEFSRKSTVGEKIKKALDLSEEASEMFEAIKQAEDIPRLIDSIAMEGTSLGRGGARRAAGRGLEALRSPGARSLRLIESPNFRGAVEKITKGPHAERLIEILETRAKNLQAFVVALDDTGLPDTIKLNIINRVIKLDSLTDPVKSLTDIEKIRAEIRSAVLEELDTKFLELVGVDPSNVNNATKVLKNMLKGKTTYYDTRKAPPKQITKAEYDILNKGFVKKVKNAVSSNPDVRVIEPFLDKSNPKYKKYEKIFDLLTDDDQIDNLASLLEKRISHIRNSYDDFTSASAAIEGEIQSAAVGVRTTLEALASDKIELKVEYSPYSLYDALFQTVVSSTENTLKQRVLTSGALRPSVLKATKSDLARAYKGAAVGKDVAVEATKKTGILFFKALFSKFVRAGFSESLKAAIPASLMAAATAKSENPLVPDQKTWDKIVDYVATDEKGNLGPLAKFIRDPLKSLNNGAVRDLAEEWGLDLDILDPQHKVIRDLWNESSDEERSEVYNKIIQNFVECSKYTSLISKDSDPSEILRVHKHIFQGPSGPDLTPYFSLALKNIKKSKNNGFKEELNRGMPEKWKDSKLPDFWQLSIVSAFTTFMFSGLNEKQNWQARSFNSQSKWVEFVEENKIDSIAFDTQQATQKARNDQISSFIKSNQNRIVKLLSVRRQQGSVNEMTKSDIAKLIKEAFTDKIYGAYPYSHNDGSEDQPKEDYIEEWKAFCLELVRDRDRMMAIQLAKVLVKDLELFEDVLDLAGQNQSIGSEILRKMQKQKDM